ncbi:response regulator [Jeotgalibacillus sp. ET6]|uniref:response regulator n=1 Tax=Jeotgalibacillus sp. ET6 TaxID=3037260 RepID=UPI0024184F74|nr:response regulator [Jeotgalibacillus sp. ET6]MDG5472750.1 response regulator [Jeotgalibacillus sp. ET6]
MQKIMIVEDNADLRTDLTQQVKVNGYEPIAVTDFERILEHFIEEKPDLVLLNVNLPFFDGYYWYRQIREYSQCPVIYLDENENEPRMNLEIAGLKKDSKKNAAVKPFSNEALTAALRSQLASAYPKTDKK